MKLLIFALLFNVVNANQIHNQNKPSFRCNPPYGYVEQSPERWANGFMETEIWKDVVGYEGLYLISNKGNVQSINRDTGRTGRKSGNFLTPQLNPSGYYRIHLRRDLKIKNSLIHRLIAMAFIPNPGNKPCINHINSIRTDNRIENLEWCTHSENNSHAHKFGAQKNYYGEKHSQAKLTVVDVVSIRGKYVPYQYTAIMLSEEYGVSLGAIWGVLNNKTWKNE